MRSYFVTGISTGVGKTISAAVLTEALQADYWKPVQTGPLSESDSLTVRQLISNSTSIFFPETWHFKEPASPHLAAAMENAVIDPADLRLPESTNKQLIIEGAGGLLVPLNDEKFVIDLAKQLDAEVILVCRNYLGCINHSLLSIDYLLRNNFRIKGLVLNGNFDPLAQKAIVGYAGIPVLARLPEMETVSREIIKQLAQQVDLANFGQRSGSSK